MAAFLLAVLIASEVAATSLLKYTRHFTRPIPSIICIACYCVCYYTFSHVMDRMNVGVAYAIWCGVGLVATNVIGYLLFRQKLTDVGVFGIVLIIIGCVIVNVWGTR
ncbi:MAG: DMT family transporter [Bilifractor sp.]